MSTVLDFREIQDRFHASLLFVVYQGLISGRALTVIFDSEPVDLLRDLDQARIEGMTWQTEEVDSGAWRLRVLKGGHVGLSQKEMTGV